MLAAMRITGGRARGIPLTTGRAAHVRPATDRTREAVFSSLGTRVAGVRFLDLFAGSGAYGLEALSRGAGGGVFVEQDAAAVAAIQDNLRAVLKSLGREPQEAEVRVVRQDVFQFATPERFGLVFMDPPYERARAARDRLLRLARALLDPEGEAVLVFEAPADLDPVVPGWECLRRLGKSGANEPSVALLRPVAQ